jgi:hypothetical protein
VPVDLHQRYVNRMLAICYDAFGAEVSNSAQRYYDWGLKAAWGGSVEDSARLNEKVRNAFMDDAGKLIGLLNKLLPAEGPKLYLTDPRFNRKNGPFAGQPYDGPERLPTAEDEALLQEILTRGDWIAAG